MWEASHGEQSSASAEAIWALWADPARWPDWNQQVESAELDADLAVGAKVRVKVRRGGRMRYEVVELDPGRLLVTESRLPGARLGHEHRVELEGAGVEITHRLYVRGPLWSLFALLLGRKRMRESVAHFVQRERELTEPKASTPSKKRRRKR